MSDRNLARAAEEALERHGDYESLWFEGTWHRSEALFDRARRLAGGLRELGVEPGDRVVVLMANCPEVGIAYNAVWRVGAVVTPAIFLLPPAELAHVVSDSGARLVLASPELADNAREAAGRRRGRDHGALWRARAGRPFADCRAPGLQPRCPDVHGRHDGSREGRHALPRESLVRRQGRPRRRLRAGNRALADRTATLARVRAAGHGDRLPRSRSDRERAHALVRARRVARAGPGAPDPDRSGRPVDAAAAPRRAARGLRPLGASLRGFGRRPASARGRAEAADAAPEHRGARGLRAHGVVGHRLLVPSRARRGSGRWACPSRAWKSGSTSPTSRGLARSWSAPQE